MHFDYVYEKRRHYFIYCAFYFHLPVHFNRFEALRFLLFHTLVRNDFAMPFFFFFLILLLLIDGFYNIEITLRGWFFSILLLPLLFLLFARKFSIIAAVLKEGTMKP